MDQEFDTGAMTLDDLVESMEIYLKSVNDNIASILGNVKRGAKTGEEDFENAETVILALISSLNELKEVVTQRN